MQTEPKRPAVTQAPGHTWQVTAPDGSVLAMCSEEPAPPPSGYYGTPGDPPGPSSGARTMLPRHSSGQPCYDQSGQWQGDGNPECSY